MCKKRDKSRVSAEDRELIENNANAVNALIIMSGDNADVIDALKHLQNKLRYLIASDNPKVLKLDGIIQNQLQDMKIYLNKAKTIDMSVIDESVREIEVSIVSRNNLV